MREIVKNWKRWKTAVRPLWWLTVCHPETESYRFSICILLNEGSALLHSTIVAAIALVEECSSEQLYSILYVSVQLLWTTCHHTSLFCECFDDMQIWHNQIVSMSFTQKQITSALMFYHNVCVLDKQSKLPSLWYSMNHRQITPDNCLMNEWVV